MIYQKGGEGNVGGDVRLSTSVTEYGAGAAVTTVISRKSSTFARRCKKMQLYAQNSAYLHGVVLNEVFFKQMGRG